MITQIAGLSSGDLFPENPDFAEFLMDREQSGETVPETPKCAICLEKDKKYTCPSCTMVTCSLECTKQHKVKYVTQLSSLI